MDYRMRKAKKKDRLSVLPDELIFNILSFVGIKDAIRTSVLSSRWRFMWTSIPHLTISTQDFSTMQMFSNFVTYVLSRRNNQLQLSSFNLCICGMDDDDVAQKIIDHAFSLNVRRLNITCFFGNLTCDFDNNTGLPPSLLHFPTYKHFKMRMFPGYLYIVPTPTHEFSSLTTLHLFGVALYDAIFTMCPNLENLALNWCKLWGSKVFTICLPRLSNLMFRNRCLLELAVKLVTPQLKKLTIYNVLEDSQIYAPELVSLLFEGHCPWKFATCGFPSLETAHLSMYVLDIDVRMIISLLQSFHNVKFLSLGMEIIQVLNSSVELISHQPSPLANLKSLKILPLLDWNWKVIMSAEVKKYLLSSSPNATLTEVLEE